MKISRNNYESWFLDYIDGKLDAGQVEVLMSFLEFNPDLKDELGGLKKMRLEAEDVKYDLKSTLRKPVSVPLRQNMLDHFEDYCISSIEHQLSSQEENMLQEILEEEPARHNTYRLYRSTILKAEKSIRYPGKSRLKKRSIDLPRVRIAISTVAAAVLLGMALTWFFREPARQHAVTRKDQLPARTEPEFFEPDPAVRDGDDPAPGDRQAEVPENAATVDGPAVPQRSPKRRDSGSAGRIDPPEPASDPVITQRESFVLARIDPMNAGQLDVAGRMVKAGLARLSHGSRLDDHLVKDANAPGQKTISFWKLADAGIQKINEVSQEEYSLERERDDSGQIRRFTLETPFFGISTPLRNTELSR